MLAEDKLADQSAAAKLGFLGRVRVSWAVHIKSPWLFVLPLALGLAVTLARSVGTKVDPDPVVLAKAVAVPPLDLFGDLAQLSLVGRSWFVPVVVILRMGLLAAYSAAAGGVMRARYMLMVYLVGYASHLALALMGYVYVMAAGQGSLFALLLIGVVPVFHVFVAGICMALTAKAAFGVLVRDQMRSLAFWLPVLIATWLWMMFAGRLEAMQGSTLGFAVAGVVLVSQSILILAAALPARANPPSAE